MRALLLAGAVAFFASTCFAEAPVPLARAEKMPVPEAQLRKLLDRESAIPADGQTVKDVCAAMGKALGASVRIDAVELKRLGEGAADQPVVAAKGCDAEPTTRKIRDYYDMKVEIPLPDHLTYADVLGEICSQLPGRWSYRVKDGAVLIGPAHLPMNQPGNGRGTGGNAPLVEPVRIAEQILGPAVECDAEGKTLAAVLKELKGATGANIVLDARAAEVANNKVAGSYSDTRLLTALKTLTTMAGLKVVSMNNVFYVTSPEEADRLQEELDLDLFGPPPAPPAPHVPPGGTGIPPQAPAAP